MKSEHRHELKTNDLSKALMTFPDYARVYGGRVAVGLVIVVLAVILITQRVSRSRADAVRYRDDIAFARSVVDRLNNVGVTLQGNTTVDPTHPMVGDAVRRLRDVRENASDKPVLAQALLAQGDLAWARANFPDMSAAATQPIPKPEKSRDEFLADAKNAYQQVVSTYPDQTVPAVSAHFGLAALAENAENWDEARKQYEAAKNTAGNIDSYKRLADMKLKALDDIRQPVLIGQVAAKFELPTFPSTTSPSFSTTQFTSSTAPAATTASVTRPTAPATRPSK